MSDNSISINQQYGSPNLGDRILNTLKSEGVDVNALTLNDLSPFDQLHARGKESTRMLAIMAGLQPGMEILDVGSGIGGPARTLAAEFGCRVIGLDITEEYVKAAEMLTDRVGLSESVSFRVGNALDLEFADRSFDAVWSQTAIMNIEDKHTTFQEAYRVLRSGGILALETIMAGSIEETQFPVFWADNPEISFLSTADNFRGMMAEIGFVELVWKDVTHNAINGNRKVLATLRNAPHPVGQQIFITDVALKANNTLRGLENGAFVYIYAVYTRGN